MIIKSTVPTEPPALRALKYHYAIARERRDKIRTALEIVIFTFLLFGGGIWLIDLIVAAKP